MTDISTIAKLKEVKNGFVQGEITHFTGNDENALMETDVERISASINTQLIDPVIDFVIASDEVIAQTADMAKVAADTAKQLADTADRTAGQSMSKANDALSKATTAETAAKKANERLDALGSIPNLDDQTWRWMPRMFDTVTVSTSGVELSDKARKPTITWNPARQNTERGRYVLEGTLTIHLKVNLTQWAGGGISPSDERSLKWWYGWVLISGVANDNMRPISGHINATSAGGDNTSITSREHVRHAALNLDRSTSSQIHFSIAANATDLDPTTNPVYVTIELKFLRDSDGDFGFGELYPPLNPI